MADELEALIALGDRRGGAAEEDAASEEAVGGQEAFDDLVALQEMGERRPRKYQRQSWELMAHARAQRAVAASKAKAASSTRRAEAAVAELSAAAQTFPVVARAVGMQAPQWHSQKSARKTKRDAHAAHNEERPRHVNISRGM